MRKDDIFEDLNIDSKGASDAAGDVSGGRKSVREDPFFEDLDLGGASGGASSGKSPGSAYSGGRSSKPPRELNTPETSIDRKKLKKDSDRKKKGRLKKIILWTVIELITLAAIFVYGYGLRTWNLIQREEIDLSAVENNNISVEKKEEMERGYWTFAVFGVDSRSDNVVAKGLNSDVIIIASINRETGDIKLVSVFRDTYLNISESNTYNKINAAYSQGGPEQALAALNKNLDLNISEYMAFNWKAVAEGINLLGGVDGISISKAELYYINAYITETVKVTGIGSYQLTSTGVQHLDGVQAVAYGRLRYMDNDFARTERQREIIKAAFEKAKTADFAVLNQIMVVCFPQVATNINFNNLVAMAQNITKYNIADTGGFPWSRGDAVMGSKGDCVIPTTLESNVKYLHEFLFGDEDYTPSDAVLAISEKIKSDTGLYSEGTVIESVSTDGGVIQKPKTSAASSDDSDDDDEEDVTIGVDDDGSYIYPTDSDGNYIIPTDEDGNVVYPTDEDGNIIKNTSSLRPTDLSDDDEDVIAPGEGRVYDDEDEDESIEELTYSSPTATTAVSPTTAPTTAAAAETEASATVSGGNYITSDGPTAIETQDSSNVTPGLTQGPGSSSSASSGSGNVISSSGPGSVTSETTAAVSSGAVSASPGSVSSTSETSGSVVISSSPGG